MIINRTIMYDDVFLFNGSTVQGTLQKRLKMFQSESHFSDGSTVALLLQYDRYTVVKKTAVRKKRNAIQRICLDVKACPRWLMLVI